MSDILSVYGKYSFLHKITYFSQFSKFRCQICVKQCYFVLFCMYIFMLDICLLFCSLFLYSLCLLFFSAYSSRVFSDLRCQFS